MASGQPLKNWGVSAMIDKATVEKIKAALLEIIENAEAPARDRVRAAELLLQYHEHEGDFAWIT